MQIPGRSSWINLVWFGLVIKLSKLHGSNDAKLTHSLRLNKKELNTDVMTWPTGTQKSPLHTLAKTSADGNCRVSVSEKA